MKEAQYRGKLPSLAPRILTAEEIERIIKCAKALYRRMQHDPGIFHESEPGMTYEDRHFRHTF